MDLNPPSGTEGAVFGSMTSQEILVFLNDHARQQLGSGIARVRFRAGRIDAVWGVELADGREVVIKTHRPPADVELFAPPQTRNGCSSLQPSRARLRSSGQTMSTDALSQPSR
jgi:hypothetical protein